MFKTAVSFPQLKEKAEIVKQIMSFLSSLILDLNRDVDELSKERIITSNYNFVKWRMSGYKESLEDTYDAEGYAFRLYLEPQQKKSLIKLLKQYEHKNKNVTLRKMTEHMLISDLFYKIEPVGVKDENSVKKYDEGAVI